uniref:Gypsy retrotransposon integrase-like protein 1 n=1 Tax=Salmo trutta TaxID=8032 RepID=A0A674CNJ5_SALTR
MMPNSFPHFIMKNGLVYRVSKIGVDVVEQLLVPTRYRKTVLDLAHGHILGGHLGIDKTRDRIVRRFYWPGIQAEVARHCGECPECQVTAPRPAFRSPLVPLPIIETPFERIAMDIVGPLPKSARGHQYILVILDYATRYPEAIPLRTMASKNIAKELVLLFTRVGVPKEILTDQGTPFMSRLMADLCKLWQVKQLRTSVYHPQTDGLVERFNRTLKSMLRKVIDKDGKNWDCMLPYLMFAIREVPQASLGFSPFELVYGRHPRGILDIARETWEHQSTPYTSVIEHVTAMQNRIATVMPIVREHMRQAQEHQRHTYNRQATLRKFQPGDKVLVLIPTVECKLLATWKGPYEVLERIGEVNYRIRQPGRRPQEQIYHINLLKAWRERETLMVTYPTHTQETAEVNISPTLSPAQVQEVKTLIQKNRDVFSEVPGRTEVTAHDIVSLPGRKVSMRPYRVPEARQAAIRAETEKMLTAGVIEESHSEWSSPIVMVSKPDGSLRFCNDFRKVNEISKFDAYPMPRVDELLEKIGKARYITTLDLTKGYWQIPLTPRAKEKTAFATPDGLFQYTVMPFGLHGAPATFQRLMDKVLKPHQAYAAAYLDDVGIYSPDWESHLPRVQAVLDALRKAGLTANPAKCYVGLEETEYLGYTVGRGLIKPQRKKVEAIREWPKPVNKKQVRAFLGLTGYYRKFIPSYATVAAPLTDMTRARGPNMVKWDERATKAFRTLQEALCCNPVLVVPDFEREFVVQTDASEVGLGAVLSQEVEGVEHPILFLSRKLEPRETNYSVVEKEALAVKWALESLKYYLLGRHFTLISDHAPLTWMHRAKEKNARVMRWFLSLQPFHFDLKHRAGKEMGNVDGLSRMHAYFAAVARPRGSDLGGEMCGKEGGRVKNG